MTTQQKFQAVLDALDGITISGTTNFAVMGNIVMFLKQCIQDEKTQACDVSKAEDAK